MPILYLSILFLIVFQSLTREDDGKITFKSPLLSKRHHAEKGVLLQLKSLSTPAHFCLRDIYPMDVEIFANSKTDIRNEDISSIGI